MPRLVLVAFIALFAFSIWQKIDLLYGHKLEHDELYVLARANGKTINPKTDAYPFGYRSAIPVTELYALLQSDYNFKTFVTDLKDYATNFYKLSNHPPLNALLAKFFIIKDSSVISLRYYALFSFLLLLFVLFFLQRELSINQRESFIALAIFSSFSLVSYQAIFPKGYSLAIALYLCSLIFFLKLFNDKKNLTNYILCFVVAHAAFLSHYLMSVFIISSFVIALAYKVVIEKYKNISQVMFYIIALAASYLIYLPVLSKQADETTSYFDEHIGLEEVFDSSSNLIAVTSLNFKGYISIAIILVFLILAYVSRKSFFSTKNNLLIILFLLPFILAPLIDILVNKNFMLQIRFVLVALPFLAILISQLFKDSYKLTLFFLIPILILNLANPKLREHRSVNYIPNQYITKALKTDSKLFADKILLITLRLTAKELIFIQHLLTKALGLHPLAMVDLKDDKHREQVEKIFITTRAITSEDLRADLKKYNIRKILALADYERRNAPKDIKFYRLKWH